MRTSRRQLLAGLSGVAACGPGPTRAPAGPPPWTPPGALDEASLPGGVRAGDPTADGLVLSVRTALPGLTLSGARLDGSRRIEVPPVRALVPVDGVVRAEVSGLEPDTEHTFVFSTPDGGIRSDLGRYRTLPRGSRTVVVGATSCLGRANPTFPTLAIAAAERHDLFLLLGDAIYTRATTLEGYRSRYATLQASPSFRDLASGTPIVAVWDDHEVANNWVLGPAEEGFVEVPPEQVDAATTAFREALPQRDGPTGRLWRTVTLGDVLELVLLDCRGERAGGRIVSDEQLAFAIDSLRASRCLFKLVASSVHVTDHADRLSTRGDIDVRDRWQGYPDQRDALLAAAEEVPGVAFVTGDMHFGAIQRVGAAGALGADLVEVAAGPAGSEPWDVSAWLDETGAPTDQYLDLVDASSSARFMADPRAGTLSVELVADDGSVRAGREIVRLA